MKKLILLAMVCLLLVSLAACELGSPKPTEDAPLLRETQATTAPTAGPTTQPTRGPESTGATGGTTPSFDMNDFLFGEGTIIYGFLDEESKQTIIEESRKEGMEVTFSPDGTMTVVELETGYVVIQKPDGTWEYSLGDGDPDAQWPDNQLTAQIPKPDLAVYSIESTDTTLSATFQTGDYSAIKAYVDQVKAAGFTLDAYEFEYPTDFGLVYTYNAWNAQGYYFATSYSGGYFNIYISFEG